MASAQYPKGIKAILGSSAYLTDGNLKLLPVKDTFIFDEEDEFLDDISAYGATGMDAVTLTGVTLSLVTSTLIKLDALDTALLWSAVNEPDDLGGAVVYYDTGDSATSFLIAFLESVTFETTGSDVQGILNSSGILGIQC